MAAIGRWVIRDELAQAQAVRLGGAIGEDWTTHTRMLARMTEVPED